MIKYKVYAGTKDHNGYYGESWVFGEFDSHKEALNFAKDFDCRDEDYEEIFIEKVNNEVEFTFCPDYEYIRG